ncbi:unnamed protein product [Rotaria sordida]|uniref:G-protein coupled receptors family 1 profile domain-containing protein n=1 Tax=Rotaria sordida TaxID=392033 RepID=A0A813S103_9BILA|nr:unnamed protein product [Rotaria sordida]CAF0836333.1 unnamed protein product [Rotaria sordida]CAF3739581.1 unnamed protein product [Rotaria sordida]CAF3753299.1 unnamed protein product [Rotaria sordida]
MILTNYTDVFDNDSLIESLEIANPCPRQRSITRPLLFVHNYALFFFGSIFNFLAFVILMQRSLRCHSTFAYLAFLSLSNGLLSLVHFSKWMFKYYFNILFESYLITCRFHRFLSDFLTHFSLFTLICVNIDRARTVTKSHPSKRYSKSKFHLILMKEILVASILCAFHFHWIIKYGSEVSDGERKVALCRFNDNQSTTIYYYFLTTIYPPFELVVFFCLPLLINIFCTIIIIRSLSMRMRTAEKLRPSKVSLQDKMIKTKLPGILSYLMPTKASKTNLHSCCCLQIQCRRHTRIRLKIGRTKRSLNKYHEENKTIDRQQSITSLSNDNQVQGTLKNTSNILNKSHRTRRTRDIHLSAMLISLNILYLLLNLPFNLHQTFVKKLYNINSDWCNIMFISLLFDALQQTFFTTNFFLYILTNRRFREEFYNTMIKILTRCKQNPSRDKQNNNNNNNQYRKQIRSSSFTASTRKRTNSTNENQINWIPTSQNGDSIISDLELPSTTSPALQQTIALINENNKSNQKLVMFKD